ncbi:hypothetical protein C8J57DRAFT_1647267 [Mycena rebaudengoi]|nr:hypothetical protein C8J57DRAFT_1647267 [Mycena rebaudengoi]
MPGDATALYPKSSWGEGEQDKSKYAFFIQCLIGTIFDAIHCAAWNADFASTVEMWMWRSCTLLVTEIPRIVPLSYTVGHSGLFEDDAVLQRLLAVIPALSLLTYPIARLFLIVLPLVALRTPAAGSLMDVNWGVYIPHL